MERYILEKEILKAIVDGYSSSASIAMYLLSKFPFLYESDIRHMVWGMIDKGILTFGIDRKIAIV